MPSKASLMKWPLNLAAQHLLHALLLNNFLHLTTGTSHNELPLRDHVRDTFILQQFYNNNKIRIIKFFIEF